MSGEHCAKEGPNWVEIRRLCFCLFSRNFYTQMVWGYVLLMAIGIGVTGIGVPVSVSHFNL